MRYLIIGMIALIAAISQAQAKDITQEDYCFQILKTAHAIMDARQAEVDINDIWNNNQSELASSLIVDAYSNHIYLSDEYKNKSADEFAVRHYVGCMRSKGW